jgi:hypothetical protein
MYKSKEHIFIFSILGILLFIALAIIIYFIVTIPKDSKDGKLSAKIGNVEPLKLYHGKKGYRLGDMVKGEWRWKRNGESYHYKNFPNSIASEYMRKTKEYNNIPIILDIINRRSTSLKIPDKNTIVIHLRVGDVIEDSKHSVEEMLLEQTYYNKHSWSNYVSPLPYLVKKVKSCDLKNIIIVAAAHQDISTFKSNLYIKSIQKYFQDLGYNVQLRVGGDPDEDVIFMSNAKYFIPATGGGFTHLITEIVKNKGGKVL